MKKISHFALSLVLAATFATPLLASAITCLPPQVVDLSNSNNCITPGQLSGSITNTSYTPSSGGGINISVIKPYSDSIISIINTILVPVLMAIAFIVFLWGVFQYFILGAADSESRKEGRQFVLWGIVGFVIILSVWALVALVQGTLSLSSGTHPNPPQI